MSSAAEILVVDADRAVQRLLRHALAAAGYRVHEAHSAAAVREAVARVRPHLVLLETRLPDADGVDLIAPLRAAHAGLPIVVLSVRQAERDKVLALDLGADDYVTKPFGTEELLARVRAALRRCIGSGGAQPAVVTGALRIDLFHRLVRVGSSEVRLSRKEYDLVAEFARHAGKVLTHRHLIRVAWGSEDAVDVQYLRVYVRQLRKKIERTPEQPRYITTELGVGYRLQLLDGKPG
jgi:two-component system KDP operon response regulator KdpE